MKRSLRLLSLVCSLISILCRAYPDLIESFKIVNKSKIVVKANKSFSRQFIKEDFFAEYDASIDLTKLNESIVTIPFILTIIPIVWVSNKIYSIKVMDKDLYYSLQEVKKVFRIFYPEQKWAGELVPQQLVTNVVIPSAMPNEPALATLFSGGLDAVDTSISHVDTKQLLITAWGADVPLHKTNMWACVRRKCEQFARTYGHEHAFVKSNFKRFIEEGGRTQKCLANKLHIPNAWRLYTSQALSLAGLAAPILVVRNISTLLIGSSYTFKFPYPCGTHPAIDNSIAFIGCTVYHDGVDRDRVQKITNICTICEKKDIPIPHLRVCWGKDKHGGNCLACDKCLRTVFNIIAAGQIPKKFGFNIEVCEAIQKTKQFLKKQVYLKKDSLIFWQNNWLYLKVLSKQGKNNSVLSDQEIQLLWEFLCSIDFEGLRDPNAPTYSPERQRQFKLLWKNSTREVFDSLVNS